MRDPQHLLADFAAHFSGGCFLAHETSGQLHGFDDFLVAGAAAQVARQRLFNCFFVRIRILVQQHLGSHDHARRAESALYRPGKNKGFLQQVGILRRSQSLDADNIRSFQRTYFGDTGTDGFAVDDHGTGAALSLSIARLFGTGEALVFS